MNKVEYVPGYPLDLSPGSKEDIVSAMQKLKLEHERVYRLITDKLNISADELDEIRGEIGKNSEDLNKKFNDAINGIKIPGKTLTIKKNGTVLGTYTGFSDVVIDIPVESGNGKLNYKEFSTAGLFSFTTDANCYRVKITATAGGGGGGGGTETGGVSGPPTLLSGGSGGDGGCVNNKYIDVQPSTSYAIAIGNGGVGGKGGGYNGSSGEATKFGELLTLTAGGGGGGSGSNSIGGNGKNGTPSGTFNVGQYGVGGRGGTGHVSGGDGHGGYMLIEW